jgi:hypothetical protein
MAAMATDLLSGKKKKNGVARFEKDLMITKTVLECIIITT